MKKFLVLVSAILFMLGMVGGASAVPFNDMIDTWGGFDSALLVQGQTFSYEHNINDTVDLSMYTVTSASLELDFTGLLDQDPTFYVPPVTIFGFVITPGFWVDGTEYVRYQLEDTGWTELGEIDTSNDVQNLTVDIGWLNDDGVLGVDLQVWNPHGQGTIQLDHSYLSGEAELRSVPEPATMLLLGTGLIGLVGLNRRRFLKK